jgi:hypothetical protein
MEGESAARETFDFTVKPSVANQQQGFAYEDLSYAKLIHPGVDCVRTCGTINSTLLVMVTLNVFFTQRGCAFSP